MPEPRTKVPFRIRMIVTVVIATAIVVVFHALDVPLGKGAVLGVTAVTMAAIEALALIHSLLRRPRVVRP